MTDLDVLVIGDCNPDVVVRAADPTPRFGQAERLVDDISLTIGGSSAITACAAARLGLRVALASVVGDDPLGDAVLGLVAARGVDVSPVRRTSEVATGCTVVLSGPSDRAMLTAPGTIAALRADMVDRASLEAARHVHVGAYFLLEGLHAGLPSLLRHARAAGASVSVDPNWDPSERWDAGLRELLPLVDVLLPNDAEARLVSGRADPHAAARTLGSPAREVVVKRGAEGALAVAGGRTVTVGAPCVDVVDTTGAGDAFDAGYIAGRLRGWDLERRLRFATACGALAATAVGGTAGQAREQDAEALMEAVAR